MSFLGWRIIADQVTLNFFGVLLFFFVMKNLQLYTQVICWPLEGTKLWFFH